VISNSTEEDQWGVKKMCRVLLFAGMRPTARISLSQHVLGFLCDGDIVGYMGLSLAHSNAIPAESSWNPMAGYYFLKDERL